MAQDASTEPVVEVTGATVMKAGRQLISELDWTIRRGERWVLFGANGSGKTTLLNVVSTYQFPARGTVKILGEQLGKTDVRELRPRIGYVGPAPAALVRLYLKCRDIVVTGKHAAFVDTRWHTYTDDDWVKADRHLETLHATHLADREFANLSEGEKKRVLIARALMAEPELLLLDEPGSGLDLGARERLVASLAALAHAPSAPTVILVTHHVEEIPPGFDRVLMLAGGRLVTAGPIDEVLHSDSLSETYDMALKLEQAGGRYRAWGESYRY
ncbi:MAG: ABC transporter ATP-binding protein [Acidimicrobiia bacterium]|nr:ABC transporter ATP-binding protein [Acidimicrobiia bacterium]